MLNITTTVKFPENVIHRLEAAVVGDGYGMRGRSRWILEAIETFLKMPNYAELVYIADDMENLGKTVSVRLSLPLMKKIEAAALEVRKIYPGLEGVKSNLIRASIIQRLLSRDLQW